MISRLRLVEEDDLVFLKELRRDPVVIENLGTFVLLNDARQKKWFDALQADGTKEYCIFEVWDEATDSWRNAGLARVTDIDLINKSACVGADLHRDFRQRGMGKIIYREIFDLCFNYWNLHRLWLVVLENNIVARRLYTSLGFTEEGIQRHAVLRKGTYLNYIMMSYIND